MQSRRQLQFLAIFLIATMFQTAACGPAPAATAVQAQPTVAPTAPAASPTPVAAPTKAATSAPTAAPTKPAAATPTAARSATPLPRTPTVAATAPAKAATTATPARSVSPTPQQLPAGTVDCGEDLACFIEASRAGRLAEVDYTMAVDFFGMFLANTDTLTIKGKDGDRLLFSQKTIAADAASSEAMLAIVKARNMSEADLQKAFTTAQVITDIMPAANATLTPELQQQLKSAKETQQARIGTGKECKFPQSALTAMLQRWQQGQYSSSDYDPAQCTDIGVAPGTTPAGASTAVPAKSATAAPAATAGAQGAGSVFGRNLIVNGDAETGTSASDDTGIVAPSGWTVTGNFSAVKYGSKGVLGKDASENGSLGISFFAGGPNNALSSATQTLDVAAGAAAIDGGEVRFEFNGYLGGLGSQEDSASVTLTFKGADNKGLGAATIGPPAAADRNKRDGYVSYGASHYVPKGTRSIEVKITMKRASGSYNDGYADGITLSLVDESAG